MSDEQIARVGNLLENSVPTFGDHPAQARRGTSWRKPWCTSSEGRSVLVIAATNLAVDNALDAIHRVNGVQKKDVLRISVPSGEFRDQWPECCERRAFDAEMAQLPERLKFLRVRINVTRRKAEWSVRLSSVRAEVSQTDAAAHPRLRIGPPRWFAVDHPAGRRTLRHGSSPLATKSRDVEQHFEANRHTSWNDCYRLT